MHILNEPSFFLINNTGAPNGETDGQICPFSKRSSSCFFISCSSLTDRQNGALEVGSAPGIKSIWCSIVLAGGSPFGKSSGNTSLYSCKSLTISDYNIVSLLLDVLVSRIKLKNICVSLFLMSLFACSKFICAICTLLCS
jgi:hypothetical protein